MMHMTLKWANPYKLHLYIICINHHAGHELWCSCCCESSIGRMPICSKYWKINLAIKSAFTNWIVLLFSWPFCSCLAWPEHHCYCRTTVSIMLLGWMSAIQCDWVRWSNWDLTADLTSPCVCSATIMLNIKHPYQLHPYEMSGGVPWIQPATFYYYVGNWYSST